jgi:hypothetical protein
VGNQINFQEAGLFFVPRGVGTYWDGLLEQSARFGGAQAMWMCLAGAFQTTVDGWTTHLQQERLRFSRDVEFASAFQNFHHLWQKWVQPLRADLSTDLPDLLQYDHHFALVDFLASAFLGMFTPTSLIQNPDGMLAMIERRSNKFIQNMLLLDFLGSPVSWPDCFQQFLFAAMTHHSSLGSTLLSA